nr:dnaj subfamily c [Hymenolepis microstoma]
MFDLMEEMKVNFYEFLDVPMTASPELIKRAYRKLSIVLHPDKNKHDPEAGEKFRQLSVIYQILRDKDRRERYDEALEHGIPDWKTPVFYYRRLRKMSNYEICTLVTIVSISIHFATLWGFAFERRWTLRERLEGHMKRRKASDKRKIAIDVEIEEQLKMIKYPTFMDILPIALLRGFINLIKSIPSGISRLRGTVHANMEKVKKHMDEKRELAEEQKERAKRKEEQKKKKTESCNMHKKNDEELDYFNNPSYQFTNLIVKSGEISDKDVETEGTLSEKKSWTQNEELAFVRLTNKYPGGFPNRWSKIAQILGRSVSDVTAKASEIVNDLSSRNLINPTMDASYAEQTTGEESEEEDDYYLSKRKAKRAGKVEPTKKKGHSMLQEEVVAESENSNVGEATAEMNVAGENEYEDVHVSRRKQKTKAKIMVEAEKMVPAPGAAGWTQKEQNQLEIAMNSFPKGTPKRWQLIAECVPSKTPIEVFDRVKFLAEHNKKKLQAEQ